MFYNEKRNHSVLKYVSPIQFEKSSMRSNNLKLLNE
ncbi:IS3 family transposase [Bacillus thuringiensis]